MLIDARRGKKTQTLFITLVLGLFLAWSGAARAADLVITEGEGEDPLSARTVAFLPFVRVAPAGEMPISICPLDRRSHEACHIDEAAEAELSRALGRVLIESAGVDWTAQERINQARDTVKKKGGQTLPHSGQLQLAIGKELGVDAVLFGFVYCYRDRSGAAIASGKPASIGFSLHLVDVRTGRQMWSLTYTDEQKALSENLLELPTFLKRKGLWVNASVMAEEAAKEVTKVLPWNAEPEQSGRIKLP